VGTVAVVRLQARKYRSEGDYYLVTVPKDIVEELSWQKGDRLVARVMEVEVDGVKRKVLVYYKP